MRPRLVSHILLISAMAFVAVAAWIGPAVGKTAQPPIATRAWYWEDARSEEVTLPSGEKVTVDSPNPFCPSAPGSLGSPEQSCAEGRLPVEIRQGDYETPNKLSAVTFDLSLVPLGSKVSKFTATFLEAKAGCYDSADEDENPNWCEETEPRSIDGKELQACMISELFGEGDARPYREVSKYQCSSSDPTAKRKEVTKGGETDHTWTFDLTKFAQEWTKEFTTNTSIMIVGKYPKGYKPGDSDPSDSWRVVLMGPKAPEGKEGVTTNIVFEEGEIPTDFPPGTTSTGTGTTGGTGTGTVSTGATSGGGFTTSGGGGFPTTSGGGGLPPTDAGGASPPPAAVGGASQTTSGLPAYVWLALIAGLLAWGLFRSVVLESAKGMRANGVLAQIHALNASKRGTELAAETAPGPLGSFFSGIKDSAGSLLGKLRPTRKG